MRSPFVAGDEQARPGGPGGNRASWSWSGVRKPRCAADTRRAGFHRGQGPLVGSTGQSPWSGLEGRGPCCHGRRCQRRGRVPRAETPWSGSEGHEGPLLRACRAGVAGAKLPSGVHGVENPCSGGMQREAEGASLAKPCGVAAHGLPRTISRASPLYFPEYHGTIEEQLTSVAWPVLRPVVL